MLSVENKAIDLSLYRMQNAKDTLNVAAEIFSKEIGKKLSRLKQERESSDYDDFYMASASDAVEQFETAKMIVAAVESYLLEKEILKSAE